MKKLNYFFTVAAGAMLLASCSNDREVVDPSTDNSVQQIVLQVASNGDGLTTRAGRPLLSEEAAQDIDVVDIYIVSKDEENNTVLNYSYTNYGWDDATIYDNGVGKMKILTIPEDQTLKNGTYTIYALGHTATDDSDYIIPTFTDKTDDAELNEIKNPINISYIENYVLKYKEGDENTTRTPEEIFAGSVELKVTGNFSKAVVLNRQVAGAYFYVYNLPMVDGLNENCELQLVASDCNDQLVLGNFANNDITVNGTNTGSNVRYVVNGTKGETAAPTNVICSTKISKWYTKTEDNNKDGIVDTENWIPNKTAKDRQGKRYVKGSIFASSFVIPFKKTEQQTLTLQIYDSDNANILQSWKVKLPQAQIPSAISYFDAATSKFTDDATKEDVNNYSIVRNHLYCIGSKTTDGIRNPDDPNDPDPDPETDPDPDPDPDPKNDPQDLMKGQILTLKVNHNWEVIYRMELE